MMNPEPLIEHLRMSVKSLMSFNDSILGIGGNVRVLVPTSLSVLVLRLEAMFASVQIQCDAGRS